MWDVAIAELAGSQFNRVSRSQLLDLGLRRQTIERRVACGKLVVVEEAVYAVPPMLEHDDWGRWSGATLTAPGSYLSHISAATAFGFWDRRRRLETITRPGNGGPRRHGGVLVYRSSVLEGETTELKGIPITTASRVLLDLARGVSSRALARALREAIRLEKTTLVGVGDCLGRHTHRRGTPLLAAAAARYAGLPLERARSGAEIKAMEILRNSGFELPLLNTRIAGQEADLSWPAVHLIVEIDGGPFHLDVGEDARKQSAWERAGWTVRRLPSDDVYENPHRLLALAPTPRRP